MGDYDCTDDVMKHRQRVEYWMRDFTSLMTARAKNHDASKLQFPEKQVFDEFTPKLKTLEFGSDEYKASLEAMGGGLRHHYKVNSHHAEHYQNGINGMTLYDLVEMVCDWLAAAEEKKTPINIDYLAERFKIEPQLVDIILNTLRDLDFWCDVNGVPVTYFTPENKRIAPRP